MEPREIRGSCILGLIYNPEISSVAGDYARSRPQKDNSGIVPYNIYYQQNDGIKSNNLENIPQASGGILPKVNRNIGASLCTFIKGYFAPDGISAHFPLIKGPSKVTDFGKDIGTWEYNPSPLVDSAKIPSPTSYTGAGTGLYPGRAPNNNNYLVIPSKPDANYPDANTVLTTWNIWEPYNIDGIFSTGVGTGNSLALRYQPQWGILYPPHISQQQQDQFCFITPSFGDGMGDAYIYCPSPNKATTIRRMFPISCDIAYRYEGLNHKPKIFYPSDLYSSNPLSPREIMSTGGANCGFQLHFQFPKQDINIEHTNSGLADGIYITWGSNTINPSSQTIETFYLQLTPGETPLLYFMNPLTGVWDNYPLYNAPVFALNGETSFSVYVHFVGPIMLIGFNSVNSSVEWFAFNPIRLKSPLLPYTKESLFYPYIPAKSEIYLTFSNILAQFRYGAIAFNNYDADGVPIWNKLNQNLSSGEKYNCRLNTQFILPNRKLDQISASEINDNFHSGRVRNPLVDELQPSTTKSNQPTYYADWRKIVDTNNKTGYELNWDQISANSIVTNTDNKQLLLCGRIIWDTTIEGPLYLHVETIPTSPDSTDELLHPLVDISEYLTGWDVTYNFDRSEQNHGYLSSTASITIKDLATTPKGRAILSLLEGNIFGVALGAGIDEIHNYFHGAIDSVETTYETSGSTTIIRATDIMSEILDNTLFRNSVRIDGFNYLSAVEYLIDCGNLKPWYVLEDDVDFLNFYKNRNLGIPYMDQSLNANTYVCYISDVISSKVKAIMSHFVDPSYPAVLYWDPSTQRVRLSWRFKDDYKDILTFFGYMDENMLTTIPSELHGVITSNGYKIVSEVGNIHAGIMLYSVDASGNQIMSYPPPSNSFSAELYNEVVNQLETLEISDNDLAYIGWNKMKFLDMSQLQIRTPQDLDAYNAVYTNNFIHKPYSAIEFSVFVTKPLHPQGTFAIRTFLQNGSEEQIENTDLYRYNTIRYTYTKSDNKIIASITGENFPPVLYSSERKVYTG